MIVYRDFLLGGDKRREEITEVFLAGSVLLSGDGEGWGVTNMVGVRAATDRLPLLLDGDVRNSAVACLRRL